MWLAEVTWRWTFGTAAALLIFLCLFEFLNTLPVSENNDLLLRSGNLYLISRALASVLQGGGKQLLKISAILAPALLVFWLAVAALGRAATLQFLLCKTLAGGPRPRVRSLLALNLLRVVTALVAVIGCFLLMLLAEHGRASAAYYPGHSGGNVRVVAALLLSAAAIGWAWAALNWILAVSAIFAGGGRRTAGAIAEALTAVRRSAGRFLTTGIWFGLLRLLVIFATTFLAFLAVGTAAISAPVAIVALFLVVLLYFALADFLHIARLAAYIAITKEPI